MNIRYKVLDQVSVSNIGPGHCFADGNGRLHVRTEWNKKHVRLADTDDEVLCVSLETGTPIWFERHQLVGLVEAEVHVL